ncbi:MAG: AhpC/TSA family protein [Anaerolineales bacterium]|nr:AhpC/TSA family protein [Anaerolineales bacterium]
MAQLCAHHAELKRLNTRVLIISFGTFPAVQQWLAETGANFEILIDRERTVYAAYQLERSRLRSRSPRTLWLYFTRWLKGQKFHSSHGDDTSQLGGDFIIDKNGLLRFVYPSLEPADRPPVSKLFQVLQKL